MVFAAASVVWEPWPATLQVWSHIWDPKGSQQMFTTILSGFEPAPKNIGMRMLAVLQHSSSPEVRAGHLMCLVSRVVELG